jgi:hypothetical protein
MLEIDPKVAAEVVAEIRRIRVVLGSTTSAINIRDQLVRLTGLIESLLTGQAPAPVGIPFRGIPASMVSGAPQVEVIATTPVAQVPSVQPIGSQPIQVDAPVYAPMRPLPQPQRTAGPIHVDASMFQAPPGSAPRVEVVDAPTATPPEVEVKDGPPPNANSQRVEVVRRS